MSVRNMQRITIYALKKHRKAILESLQRKGVLEVENLELEDSAFVKEETAQKQALFLKTSSAAGQACEVLCSYFPEKRTCFLCLRAESPFRLQNIMPL